MDDCFSSWGSSAWRRVLCVIGSRTRRTFSRVPGGKLARNSQVRSELRVTPRRPSSGRRDVDKFSRRFTRTKKQATPHHPLSLPLYLFLFAHSRRLLFPLRHRGISSGTTSPRATIPRGHFRHPAGPICPARRTCAKCAIAGRSPSRRRRRSKRHVRSESERRISPRPPSIRRLLRETAT